ncbi:glutathione S-transferase family protein, partial [Klebsiella pneumoniae]|nr:glutathione S-transferase family protein [Klebsiella pneumoniae]
GDGPWFDGARYGLVDAVFGPVFRYFDVITEDGLFGGLSRVQAWRTALSARPSVRDAVTPDYADRLKAFLLARGSA